MTQSLQNQSFQAAPFQPAVQQSHVAALPGADPEAPLAVRFSLQADPHPGLLPRLFEPFSKRGLVPDRMSSRREGDSLRVEFALDAMPANAVHLVAGNLGQVIGVLDLAVTRTPTLAAVA